MTTEQNPSAETAKADATKAAAAKPRAAKAAAAKADVPTLTEGTRQELEIHGRSGCPFTGGAWIKHPDTGEYAYYAPGEDVPDHKPAKK